MIEARMTDLNYNEVLYYLGYRGQECSEELDKQIRRCMREVVHASVPRLVYRKLNVSQGQVEGISLTGKDISELLIDCSEAILMAVTLGPKVERLLMRTEVTNMADALIMDACASAAIENVSNNLEQDLRLEMEEKGMYLTDRFSPGYGDLPMESQQLLCRALQAEKRIGLTVTANHIMIPRKSVTAIIGIADKPQALRKRGCENCSMFLRCSYRKEGKNCNA